MVVYIAAGSVGLDFEKRLVCDYGNCDPYS